MPFSFFLSFFLSFLQKKYKKMIEDGIKNKAEKEKDLEVA